MNKFPNFRPSKSGALLALEQIGKQLGLAVEEDCNRYEIALPAAYSNGELLAYEGKNGISALILKASPKKDWEINFDGPSSQSSIIFYTVVRGPFVVRSASHEVVINSLQSSIHGGFGKDHFSLCIEKGTDAFGVLIMLDKVTFLDQIACDELELPQDLLNELAKPIGGDPQFLFQEIQHLPLVENLQDIVKHPETGLMNSTFAMAKLYENIYLQLKIYSEWSAGRYTNGFREAKKIEMLKNAEEILKSRLKDPPTIPELAKMVGTNIQTLKQGFRQLFGLTINQFVNEQRMEKAKMMMREANMTLGEIAAAVGYSSGSYFSKRFKELYGASPSCFVAGLQKQMQEEE